MTPTPTTALVEVDSDGGVFGSGGRVGYIAPSTCERVAREFYETVPEDVALLIASLTISQIHEDHVDRALQGIEAAAIHLAGTGADIVFGAGMPLALKGGVRRDRELKDRLEQVSGLPCGTELGNTLRGCERLELDRVVMVSPFKDDVNAAIARVLAEGGVDVLGHHGSGLDRQIDYQRLGYDAPRKAIRDLLQRHPDARGVYMACGRFGYVRHITGWEEEFGVPVVTGNQLMIWWALESLGVSQRSPEAGQLMRSVGAL